MMESPAGGKGTPPSKKRRRTPSLSPRRGKRKLSLTEVRKHVNSPTQVTKRKNDPGCSSASASAVAPNSIKAFFAKAKPPQYTTCPVCESKVKLSEINRHLDAGCLSQGGKQKEESSPEIPRKIADLRTEAKDKRVRRRLQEKFDNSPLYRHSSSSSSSDDLHSSGSAKAPGTPTRVQGTEKQACHDGDKSEQIHQTCSSSSSSQLYSSGTSVNKVMSSSSCEGPNESHQEKPKAKARLSLKKIGENKSKLSTQKSPSTSHKRTNSKTVSECVEEKTEETKNTSPYFKMKQSSVTSTSTASANVRDSVECGDVHSTRGSVDRHIPENSQKTTKFSGSLSKLKVNQSQVSRALASPPIKGTPPTTPSKSTIAVPPIKSTASGVSPGRSSVPGSLPSTPDKKTLPTTPSKATTAIPPARSTTLGVSPARSSIPRSVPSTPIKRTPPTTPSEATTAISPARSTASGVSPARSPRLGSPHKPKEPYYMVNFKLILNAVLKNEFDAHLFNDEDHDHLAKFNGLSGPAQQLYVRLFQRKYTWFCVTKLDYPRIAQDLRPLVKELISAGLLMTETALSDLSVTLKLLMAPDLKQMVKELKITGGGGGGMQKPDLIAAILKYASSQRSIFTSNMNSIVLRKAKKLLGHCVRLRKEPRVVFKRIILLFSLVRQDLMDEDKGSAGQSALYTELLVNMGKMSYPVYTVFRTRSFFASREDLLRYEVAMQYESDIADALAINDFELADRLQTSAMEASREQHNEETLRHDESLPEFVRCFTAGWVYTHIGYQGVDIRQKQRRYKEAVELLRGLLKQTTYCPDRRGGWWDRLALNLDQHCKKQDECLDCIKEGLADPYVRTGHRLALQQRAQKVLRSKKKHLAERAAEFQFDEVMEIPKVTIKGTVLPHHGPGVRNTFISSYQGTAQCDEGIVVCSVEQVALEHYKQQGYTEGIHGEGTTYSTLIFILFWDIVFQPNIPDVFCYPYQSAPLDLRTDHFYRNRWDAIQQRLREMREADTDHLLGMLQRNWLEYEGDLCVGVSWDIYRDIDQAKSLLRCIGGPTLSSVADRMLQDHRHCRAGLPDLTVWNPSNNTFRVVEVKGPGDRLAQKQILWLDFFLRLGVQAEVCHVEAVGSKQLKRRVLDSQEVNSSSSQGSWSSQQSGTSQESTLSQEPRSSQTSRTSR